MTRSAWIFLCVMPLANVAMAHAANNHARVVIQTVRHLDLNYCLNASRGKAAADAVKCPTFITEQLPEMDRWCTALKGTLQPGADPEAETLDIDGDGKDEYLFMFDGNLVCTSAASLFSCGSSPCSQVMYQRNADNDKWHEVGYFPIGAQFAAIARADDAHHPDLRIHCEGDNVCDPALYRWQTAASSQETPNAQQQISSYQETERTLRGFVVTMFMEGQLIRTTQKIAIYAAPRADSNVLYESDSGSYFTVFGEVKNTGFVAASACIACEPGFVHRTDLGFKY